MREAAGEILRRARDAKPKARIDGVTVFPMIVRPKARELIVGIADDPTFGPVVVFGQGGTAVEVDRRQGAGAAATRSGARAQPDRAHPGVAPAQSLPQRTRG